MFEEAQAMLEKAKFPYLSTGIQLKLGGLAPI